MHLDKVSSLLRKPKFRLLVLAPEKSAAESKRKVFMDASIHFHGGRQREIYTLPAETCFTCLSGAELPGPHETTVRSQLLFAE
jgi:hypothetical protein